MPADPASGDPAGGFTLLEVLVAFVIAAFALSVLLGGSAAGLSATGTALRYEEAVARAQSHLAAAAAEAALYPQDRQGLEGHGYRWHVRVAAQAVGATPVAPGLLPALYDLTVDFAWTDAGQHRAVSLHTQRVGTVPAPPP